MALSNIIKISAADYATLAGGGSITKNGVTYTYDANALYLIEETGDVITNPMTAAGDLIVGGSSGAPTRLALGSSGKFLKSNGSTVVWDTVSAGMTNPMTTQGDIIYGGSSGTPKRLAKGTAGKFLQMNSGGTAPIWGDAPKAEIKLIQSYVVMNEEPYFSQVDDTGSSIRNVENDISAAYSNSSSWETFYEYFRQTVFEMGQFDISGYVLQNLGPNTVVAYFIPYNISSNNWMSNNLKSYFEVGGALTLSNIDSFKIEALGGWHSIAECTMIVTVYTKGAQQYQLQIYCSGSNYITSGWKTLGGGSAGGASATRIKYHIEVEDSNGNKAIIPIYQDTFEDYLVEFNQIGQTLATAQSTTWATINNISEFKTFFDQLKSTQNAPICDLIMNVLVRYSFENNNNPYLITNGIVISNCVFGVSAINPYDLSNASNYYFGGVFSVLDSSSFYLLHWFKTYASEQTSQIDINSQTSISYTEQTESASGGSSLSTTNQAVSSGVDYMQMICNNNHIIIVLEKGALNESSMASEAQQLINFFNQQYSLSIPNYTKIEDYYEISEYFNTLSSAYDQVKIVFYSALFYVIKYCVLSVKGYVNGEVCPISIDAEFDQNNSIYTYDVKYLSANSSPLAYASMMSSSSYSQIRVFVNNLD